MSVFAMLSGVLVVAFPVSVFSDLWSEELKEVKGFNDLFDNDTEDNDNDDVPSSANVNRPRKIRAESNSKIDDDVESRSKDSEYVVIEKADLNEILASLRTIRQEQQNMKRLLRKYYVVKDE